MSDKNSLIDLLEQIELSVEARKVLEDCAETTVEHNLTTFDPLLTVKPYIFNQELKILQQEKQINDLQEDIDRIQTCLDIEKEQIAVLEALIDLESSSQVPTKELTKMNQELNNKIKQYTKELISSESQVIHGSEKLDFIIQAYEKLRTQK